MELRLKRKADQINKGKEALFFDDDFEGAKDGSGGADIFTTQAPAAGFRLNYHYYIIDKDQGFAGAGIDAQSATVAFCQINYRHLYHGTFSPHLISVSFYSAFCM